MIIIIIMIKSMAEADFMLCITYCKQSGNLEGSRLTKFSVAGSINRAFALFPNHLRIDATFTETETSRIKR